jgi:DNA polymerase-3 subunit gamma/tau
MTYQVIARKYRPQTFDEVVGQEIITATLKNAVLNNRVAHGYIFSGARGVGKTTTARILAKAVNCAQGPTVTPCGQCDSCREIAAGNAVDVVEIDAASNRGIDEIRELRENARYLPARDRNKIFIIDEAHMLTVEAFNALLKTLEEPPPHTLFILATTEAHKLPTTIQSRCQHFAFRLLDYGEILSRLEWVLGQEGIRGDEGSLAAIARAAEGSLRDALSLLDQVIAACGTILEAPRTRQVLGVTASEVFEELMAAIDAGAGKQALERVGRLAAEGQDPAHFCGEFARYLRDLVVVKCCGAESPLLQVPNQERPRLERLAKPFSEEDLARFFHIILRAESEMRYALDPRLNLELALLKLVYTRKLAPLEGLLSEILEMRPAESGRASEPRSAGGNAGAQAPANTGADDPRAESAEEAAPNRSSPPAAARGASDRPLPAVPAAEDALLAKIKSAAFNRSKWLGSCLEPLCGWRFENGEVEFIFPRHSSWSVELLNSPELREKLRAACAEVLCQEVQIRVKLDSQAMGPQNDKPSARARAETDAGVAELRKRFGCTVVEVVDLSQE